MHLGLAKVEFMTIVGIGETVWDCLPEGRRLGGAPVNFCYFAKELGAEAYPVTAVGDDALGDETLKELERTGLDLNYVSRDALPTGRVLVTLDEAGVPKYDIVENVAWDALECTPAIRSLVSGADAVCWGSLAQRSVRSREAVMNILDSVPAAALKVFDINIREPFYSKEVITESLKRADVLKLNEDELPLLMSLYGLPSDADEAIARLVSGYSLKYVLFTQGAVRSGIYDASGEISSLPTPKVKVVDTVGAGDSFTAAFVTGLLKGDSVAAAHRRAVDVSAFVCTRSGVIHPLPADLR